MEEVITDESGEKSATVIVPDYQLSLAIGKEGQNVRLAAKVSGWKIDIKSRSQYDETKNREEEAGFIEYDDDVPEDDESVIFEEEEVIPAEASEALDTASDSDADADTDSDNDSNTDEESGITESE